MRPAHSELTVFPEQRLGNRTKHLRALGYFFRCVLVLLCSYGCVRTVFDAIGAPLPAGLLPVSCLVFCTVFCIAALTVKTAAAGAAAGAVGVIAVLSYKGGVVKVSCAMGAAIYNAWCARLDSLGYRIMPATELLTDTLGEIGSTEAEMYLWGAVFASLLVCAVFTALGARRVRLIPLLFLVLSVCMYFVMYGALEKNVGPVMTVVAVTGLSAQFYFENIFANKRAVREALGADERSASAKKEIAHTVRVSSELGGIFGMTAALLMAVLIAVPAGTVGAMKDIPTVSGMIRRSADVVTSVTEGRFPGVEGLLYIGRGSLHSRNTELAPREPDGAEVLSVSTDVNVPVYLRGWTGVDYVDDSWKSASYSRMDEYRRSFGKGFSAELLTNELLFAVDPSLTELPVGAKYIPHGDFGYVIAPVHIKKQSDGEKDMLLPSYTDPEVNLLLYGTNTPHFAGYGSYFEGIFTSPKLSSDESYSVKAHLALPPTSEILMNISLLVRHYNEQRETVSAIRTLLSRGAGEEDIQNEYLLLTADKPEEIQETTMSGQYTFPSGHDTLAYRYVYEMTGEERGRVDALIDSMNGYNNFVYSNYITVCENYEAFDALADKIIADSGTSVVYTYAGRHRMVEAVINYLSANMTYTLTPREPTEGRPYYNSAETFLFDTGEGYCVQYATSAVMLLRCLGIPARYASGYIASSFEPSSAEAPGAYTATVTEDEAHAWIEVYYDYYGWMQYEATSPFVTETVAVPTPEENPAVGWDTAVPDTLPEDTASPDTAAHGADVQKDSGVTKRRHAAVAVTAAVVATAVIIGAVACVIIIKARGERSLAEFRSAIASSRQGGLSPEQMADMTDRLGAVIYKLLSFKGLTPGAYETPAQFFGRADEMLGEPTGISFEAVCEAVQAYEFGGEVSGDRLLTVADCADSLYSHIIRTEGALKAAYVKYFCIAT